MIFTKHTFKVNLAFILCLFSLAKVAFAVPKSSNGLTFDWVGQGGTLDVRYNHMSYIPVKVTASTDYIKQIITIKSGLFSDYVSLCPDDHCGYTPIGEPYPVTACNLKDTTTLGPNQSCFVWLKAKNYVDQLPFHKPSQQAQLNINSKECSDDSCSVAQSVTYQPQITIDVDNSLYAGGEKGLYSDNSDSSWNKVATVNDKISSMALFEGDLYFGGDYTLANDKYGVGGAAYLNRLTCGNHISDLSLSGMIDGGVNALATYYDDNQKEYSLEIGGAFTNYYGLLRRDGTHGTVSLPGINAPLEAIKTNSLVYPTYKEILLDRNGNVLTYEYGGWKNITPHYYPDWRIPNLAYAILAVPTPNLCIGYQGQIWYNTSWITWNPVRSAYVVCYNPQISLTDLFWPLDTEDSDYTDLVYALDFNASLNRYFAGGSILSREGRGVNILYSGEPSPYYALDGLDATVYTLLSIGQYVVVGGKFNRHEGGSDILAHGVTSLTVSQDGRIIWNEGFPIPPMAVRAEPAIHSLIMAPLINNTTVDPQTLSPRGYVASVPRE